MSKTKTKKRGVDAHGRRIPRRSISKIDQIMAADYTLKCNTPDGAGKSLDILLTLREAYDMLRDGTAVEEHWSTLAMATNVGLVRAESIGPAAIDVARDAMDAVAHCRQVYLDHGRYGFGGQDFEKVEVFLDYYDQLVKMSTPLQMQSAMREASRRIFQQMREIERQGGRRDA